MSDRFTPNNGNGHEAAILVPSKERLERQREEYNARLKAEAWASAANCLAERYRGQPRICLNEGLRGTLHKRNCKCENCWSILELEDRAELDEDENAFTPEEYENLHWWLDHSGQVAAIPEWLALVRLADGNWFKRVLLTPL